MERQDRRFWTTLSVVLVFAAACGNGRWGSEVRLELTAFGPDESGLEVGSAIPLNAAGSLALRLERACLSVEAVALSPPEGESAAPESGGHDHGGGVHAGEEGSGGGSASTREIDRVVDLLAGTASLSRHGLVPGEYEHTTLTFGPSHGGAEAAAPGCGDMAGRTLLVTGRIEDISGTELAKVTVDLRAEIVTEAIETHAVAPLEGTAEVDLHLDLGVTLAALADLAYDGSAVVIGGEFNQNPVVAGLIAQSLVEASSYAAEHEGESGHGAGEGN